MQKVATKCKNGEAITGQFSSRFLTAYAARQLDAMVEHCLNLMPQNPRYCTESSFMAILKIELENFQNISPDAYYPDVDWNRMQRDFPEECKLWCELCETDEVADIYKHIDNLMLLEAKRLYPSIA